ncbi:bifunctional glutamate N-acetyltransferase/amino-acid acetyltransferase ArgJ [Pseudohalocynthiibacter aestuariivivens]|uniref:Arginine biosynthesis bifunctional protein ArgJ n=1 Tax=Pseudohalocynthiibacter aestuariivivens TaxID=1591409 RepID=A0ABV5JJU8_9RHOB|nr:MULTISPECIES: bifunctional glutamate N-acetyltransferase/amino-acid acetyltransferase ArgJ [Pseudohalocynthiibacter]MBS9717606.1 bifunctional glutamate N-acetyltransferase/amino-acid acetyltransferase ArgJ [Pseudohalocynthiibacter aestuariivivens]MCK0102804.1 bifunctional glutamate N-acetyltransferase/amino-acid acetyltransferase ArgJ [Pseudohalocynthiibacter sp. F2068]
MGKSKKIKKLKKKLLKLRKEIKGKSGPLISPLAPKGGFPDLPEINGAEFAAVEAGVRYSGRKDIMLAKLAPGTAIAGVFTRSATRAAPVLDCEAKLGGDSGAGAAIIVNSGNANAFTGTNGKKSVEAITGAVSSVLGIPQTRIFSASTGVIGEPLPHERIVNKLQELKAALSAASIQSAAQAIMTTDTFAKGSFTEVDAEGPIRIVGIAKGSGMIAPDMATMLVYIFTDAQISQTLLQQMLSDLTRKTFNCITVDSDTSTSDTLILAATQKSSAPEITDIDSAAGSAFYDALHKVMLDLAHQVVRDGEGATKFVEVRVAGAETEADAHKIAMAIANSPLVKTAIAGEDPNWGRVVMAVGKSGAKADRDKLSIRFGDILVAENGWVSPDYREEDAAEHMKGQNLLIAVDMGLGSAESTAWTCDLTNRYIEINADYRS